MTDPMTVSPLAIVTHTPGWVWGVLGYLVVSGFSQARPRQVTLARLTLLPAVLAALSLAGVATAFGALGTLGWAVGLAATVALGLAVGAPKAARWLADERRLALPGSWLPLALMLGLFAIKFAVGVLTALSPALNHDVAFALSAGLAYGAFSGLFAGRAMAWAAVALADRPAAERT